MIKTEHPPGSNRIAETSSTATRCNYSASTTRGAACFGFGDHRPLTGENEIEPGF
jgi:hypothetical protein